MLMERGAWNRTAALAAVIHNSAFGREEGDAKSPEDFHPHYAATKNEPLEVSFDVLKNIARAVNSQR